ncbi:MAG: hypothetical protein ACYSUQ_02950 [Planctomycetota bacterium]
MIARYSTLVVIVLCASTPPVAAQQTCFGSGDFNSDGLVGLDDHALFWDCLGGPDVQTPPSGCDPASFARADQDDDGDVDLFDSALFAASFGNQYFDYGPHRDNLEAELLAMDLTGQLRAPETEYQRILGDLQLIRSIYTELVTVIDDPDWVSDQLLVGMPTGEPAENYEQLNAYYMAIDEDIHATWRVVTFCDNLNPVVLAPIYAALPEVNYAEPNYFIGTDDQITITILGTTYRYLIDDGFLDCFDGCDCHRVWEIDVTAGGRVALVSYEEWGMSWCVF